MKDVFRNDRTFLKIKVKISGHAEIFLFFLNKRILNEES